MQENTPDRTTNKRYVYRTIIFSAFALVLAILSIQGELDNYAQERVADTTGESVGIYVISRGINAAISTLQSSEVGIGIASVQIGQMLDPINDAVERLSSIMVWAIGSLLLQRFTLQVASSTVFQWGFFAVTVVTIATLIVAELQRSGNRLNVDLARFRVVIIRIFVLATMVRFIVPTFLAFSFLVSQQLLQPEIEGQRESLAMLSEELSGDEQQIQELATDAEQFLNDEDTQEPAPDVRRSPLEILTDLPSDVTSAVASILPDVSMPSLSRITVLRDRAVEFVQNVTELLVLVAIKNIVLPLVFLMIAVKGAVPIAKGLIRLTATTNQESKALKTT